MDFNLMHLCDAACPGRVTSRFIKGEQDLQFCGHHTNKLEAGLIGAGFSKVEPLVEQQAPSTKKENRPAFA